MFEETKIKYVEIKEVWCEGEDPKVGHPRVYLNMDNKNEIICPYCNMHFSYQPI